MTLNRKPTSDCKNSDGESGHWQRGVCGHQRQREDIDLHHRSQCGAVYAGIVLEAAAAGLKQIRETEMIGDEGVEDLTMDIKTTTSHKVPLVKLKAWLQSSGRDPREGL